MTDPVYEELLEKLWELAIRAQLRSNSAPGGREMAVEILQLVTGRDTDSIAAELRERANLQIAYGQNLGPLIETLTIAEIEHNVVNTGGNCMVVYVRTDPEYQVGLARSEKSLERHLDDDDTMEIAGDLDGWDVFREHDGSSETETLAPDATMERALEIIRTDHGMVSEFSLTDLYQDADRTVRAFRQAINDLATPSLSISIIDTPDRLVSLLKEALRDIPLLLFGVADWYRANSDNAWERVAVQKLDRQLTNASYQAGILRGDLDSALTQVRRVDWRTPGDTSRRRDQLPPLTAYEPGTHPTGQGVDIEPLDAG